MNATITIPTPGHCPCCAGCRNRTGDLMSHPTPCLLVKWRGQRRVGPDLRDGVFEDLYCNDFAPEEPAPSGGG